MQELIEIPPLKRKGPDDCEYLEKIHDIIPDDRAPQTAEEHIRYWTCIIQDLTPPLPCVYPQKYCIFKAQEEQIYLYVAEIANNAIGE